METREQVLRVHDEMRAERALEEQQWRDIARLVRPDQEPLDVRAIKRIDVSDLFDSTGLYANDAFAGGIFGQLTNPANRWLTLGLDDDELAAWPPVKRWLHEVATVLLGSADAASSSFYAQIPAAFADTGAFGMGTVYSEEAVGRGRYVDRAIPIGESYIRLDADGELTRFHREFRLSGHQIKAKYGEAAKDARDTASYIVVHAVYENRYRQPGRLGPAGMAWCSTHVSPDLPSFSRQSGYEEMPYATALWSQRSGRTYPIGPGHLARPDLGMLNEMERSHIVAAQFAAEPMTLLHDESNVRAADIAPNAVLYGTMTDQGKALLQTVTRAADVRLSREQSEQRRQAVRNAFYFGIMQLVQRPQMTATEFLGFQEENLRLMAPNLARIQSGLLSPWVSRRYRMLERAGRLPPPPPELEGMPLRIEYVSPLAKAQKLAEGRATLQIMNGVLQWAAINPEVADNLDFDAAARSLHDAFGGVPALMRDPRDVEERRRNRAQQQARQLQLAEQQQEVSIAAEASHALQAQTRAKQRSLA